ncbi:hypothetical protein ACFX2B_012739 [Malus domestica]
MFNQSLLSILVTLLIASVVKATVDPVQASGHGPILKMYMHDILGGSSPTARPITDDQKGPGIYIASSADGSTQMMAFTAIIEGGEYGDALNFYGIFKIGSPMSHLTVIGGTGKFKSASRFAEVKSLIPPGQHVSDGVEESKAC